MSFIKKFTSALILAAFFTGCANVPYNKSQRVERDTDFWQGKVYKQNGQIVNSQQMITEFRKDPSKAHELQGIEAQQFGAVVSSVGAGFLLGYGLGKAVSNYNQDDYGWFLLGGAALGAVAILLGNSVDNKINSAIDLHNQEVQEDLRSLPAPDKQKSGQLLVSPFGIAWVF